MHNTEKEKQNERFERVIRRNQERIDNTQSINPNRK